MTFAIVLLVIAVILWLTSLAFRKPNKDKLDALGRSSHEPTGRRTTRFALRGVAALLAILATIVLIFSCFYTQDRGQTVIKQDVFGNVKGTTQTTGLHTKAPWEKTIRFNTLNQVLAFGTPAGANANESNYSFDGPHVTVTDKNAVGHDVDVTTTYSIQPSAVADIYTKFRDQRTFEDKLVAQDIRTVVREAANQFTTEQLLTDKAAYALAIEEGLRSRWATKGITLDQVNLQEVRSPESVKIAFDEAQAAQINVEKQRANLEAAEVQAQQQVAKAKAEAESNEILESSLTDKILQQKYLETLQQLAAAGNLVVVPDGFSGMIQTR